MRQDDLVVQEFLDHIQERLLGKPVATGRDEVSQRADLALSSVTAFWHALGFPAEHSDSGVFTEADLVALHRIVSLIDDGGVDEQLALGMTRAVARTADRLSVWQTQLVAESVAPDVSPDGLGADPQTAAEVARRLTAAADAFEPLLVYAWRRHLYAALTRMVSDADPAQASSGPVRLVGFADLVNFTSVVRRATERELAVVVQRFERLASDIVTAHGGRVIKTVGDEILFVNQDPVAGTAIALDLVDTMAEEEVLPQVRVGLAYGPVLSRLGDVFGTTVNRASRLTAVAGEGRVLADEALAARLAQQSGFRLRTQRRRLLRGIGTHTPREVTRSHGGRRSEGGGPLHTMGT